MPVPDLRGLRLSHLSDEQLADDRQRARGAISRALATGGAALGATMAARSAYRGYQSAFSPSRGAPWWDQASSVAAPLYGAYQYGSSAARNLGHAFSDFPRSQPRMVYHSRSRPFLQSWRVKKLRKGRARSFSRTRFGLRSRRGRHVAGRRPGVGRVQRR